MTRPMNCQAAQEQLQQLLDRRWNMPLPSELQDHLDHCEPCQSWQVFFSSRPHVNPGILPAGFAGHVLNRYSQEQRRSRWLRYSSLLSMAAVLAVAILAWIITIQRPHQQQFASHQPAVKPETIIVTLKQDLEQMRGIAGRIPAINVPIPGRLPSWDMLDLDDPLPLSMPAIRTIGATLQEAVEPYEAPARAAYQKVKSLVDGPDVKKWVDNVKKRWS